MAIRVDLHYRCRLIHTPRTCRRLSTAFSGPTARNLANPSVRIISQQAGALAPSHDDQGDHVSHGGYARAAISLAQLRGLAPAPAIRPCNRQRQTGRRKETGCGQQVLPAWGRVECLDHRRKPRWITCASGAANRLAQSRQRPERPAAHKDRGQVFQSSKCIIARPDSILFA